MIKKDPPAKPEPPSPSKTINNNNNDVKVNNHFSLTINLGDSLNLAALLALIFIIRKFSKRKKDN